MAKIHDIKAARDKALAHAREIVDSGTASELRAASVEVEKLQAALMAHIVEGADPCPRCGAPPVGLEHPTGKGGFEYEIGCSVCPPFDHTDSAGVVTLRAPHVRGGLLPRHAVEMWNLGVDSFNHVPPHKVDLARAKIRKAKHTKAAADALAAEEAEISKAKAKATAEAEAKAKAAESAKPKAAS